MNTFTRQTTEGIQ